MGCTDEVPNVTGLEQRERLIEAVTGIITRHQVPDYGNTCHECGKHLYGEKGCTLSRHRAEVIVRDLDLEAVFAKANIVW